jgi:hypothetical protein
MANEEPLGPFWDYLRARGITFPESTGTISIGGHEFLVEIPEDLVAASDE